MLQGVLLNFGDRDLESDYRAEWASENFRADCGLYMLALSLWVIIWHTLYIAGDWRHVWSAANAVMCFCTLLGMRYAVLRYMPPAQPAMQLSKRCPFLRLGPSSNADGSWCCKACTVDAACERGSKSR